MTIEIVNAGYSVTILYRVIVMDIELVKLEYEGKQITLIPTAHVSKTVPNWSAQSLMNCSLIPYALNLIRAVTNHLRILTNSRIQTL